MAKLKDKLKPAIDVAPAMSPAPTPAKQSFQPVVKAEQPKQVVAPPNPNQPNRTAITQPDGSVKYQERIPGTNTIKEYDASGKLLYFGGNDPETRKQVELYNQKLQSEKQLQATQTQVAQTQQELGQISPEALNPNDPLTQDIIANIQGQQDYSKILDYSGTARENLNRNAVSLLSRVAPVAVKILNKASLGANLGTGIVEQLANDDDVKRVMNKFDTTQNVKDVRDNIKRAEELKLSALALAKTDPVKARQNYELYLSVKRKSLAQMKALSHDPKQFNELKLDIQLLNDYFDPTTGIKAMDDLAMAEALNME